MKCCKVSLTELESKKGRLSRMLIKLFSVIVNIGKRTVIVNIGKRKRCQEKEKFD